MMTSPSPLTARVAVIVPAYGVAHLLHEALDSLLAQSLADWECVVIDDGAPDDVAGAVAPYLADSRIRFLATDNRGVSAARNRAVAQTSAPYVALLDGDDRFTPDYLSRTLAVLDGDPDARLVTCNALIFGAVAKPRLCFTSKQGSLDGTRGSLADVLDRSFGIYIGTTFRRADFETVGGFDEDMTHAEDLDLWVRLMLLGGHAHYVDEVLGEYRVRASSASASAERMLLGNIRVYEKALTQLAGRGEAGVAHNMIDRNRRALAFEHAVDQVIDGDTQGGIAGINEHGDLNGPMWMVIKRVWSIWPGLARPTLQWRRRSHSRGNTESFASFLRTLARGSNGPG
ncbi:glycosyltransferase family A protein [Qipengyuania soli]|uniref:Glycosyltransferase family 2 protein n=1 Tax=Qipengyuania soli TaxID=2782568 RepID=A0A7S8F2S7_9SPHN|nr:glycosyltransferase family A protein [Qipengyuania soli]QPC98174.1 glycosyltransferase family 2 protein [Qipengyuania soli]